MTNLEKLDCAIMTTLEAHPDYQDIMGDILLKKLLEEDPLTTAKFFSRANDARAHIIEVSDLDLLAELVKNAVKVSYLFQEKGLKTSNKEKDLDGKKDSLLVGSTACRWVEESLRKHQNVNLDELLDAHPEILPLLVSVFMETRYQDNCMIKKEELDDSTLLSNMKELLNRIDADIHAFD